MLQSRELSQTEFDRTEPDVILWSTAGGAHFISDLALGKDLSGDSQNVPSGLSVRTVMASAAATTSTPEATSVGTVKLPVSSAT